VHSDTELSPDELALIEASKKLKILDSPFETLFDSITHSARDICKTPMALISFNQKDCQSFKSYAGFNIDSEESIAHDFVPKDALRSGLVEVEDTFVDARYQGSPLSLGTATVRYYAAAPIKLPLGEIIGSLCVIDTDVNQLSDMQKAGLEALAKVVGQALIIRKLHLRQEGLMS
jgi:GAF domain-containing protein